MPMEQKKHVCVLCNAELPSKEDLQMHFRRHANKEIDLKGRVIGPGGQVKSTTSNGVYIRGSGSQVNTNIKCDVCGEEFTCNTKAIQHKFRKHPFDAAKHYCPQCGMQFPLQGHRDKHLKEQHESDHVPRNPYPCYQCGAIFFNQAAHEYHDKTTHHRVVTLYKQIQTPGPSKKIRYNNAGEPQSVYYCHLCGQEYIVKFNLQKHLERQHPPEQRNAQPTTIFKCNTCDALFYNTKAYHNHNIHHKADDLYVTSEEQRLQVVTRVDQDFDIRRVQPAAERYIPKFRQRRSKLPPPKLDLPSLKVEDEELSPPPNSDTDSEPEPPPEKKPPSQKKKLTSSKLRGKTQPPFKKKNLRSSAKDEKECKIMDETSGTDSLNNNGGGGMSPGDRGVEPVVGLGGALEGVGGCSPPGLGEESDPDQIGHTPTELGTCPTDHHLDTLEQCQTNHQLRSEDPLGTCQTEHQLRSDAVLGPCPTEHQLRSDDPLVSCTQPMPVGTNLLPGIENPEEPVLLQAL